MSQKHNSGEGAAARRALRGPLAQPQGCQASCWSWRRAGILGVRGGECACAACTCVCACLGVRLGCARVDVRVFVVCLHCACAVNAFVCVLRTFRALVPVLLRAHTCVSVSVSLCVCVHELCARICVCAPSDSNNRPPAPRSRFPANNRTRRRLWDQHPPMFCSSGSASRPQPWPAVVPDEWGHARPSA